MRISLLSGDTGRAGRLQIVTGVMRLWASIAIAMALVITGAGISNGTASVVAMQESTPEVEEPPADEETTEDNGTPVPSDASESSDTSPDISLSEGQPAVLAQGLTYVPEGDKTWTASEIDVPALDEAESDSGGSAMFLQRQGSTIIRNDVTGKRAKLEPGEAFFRAPEDNYTSSADGSGSKLWSFELVDTADADPDAFYEGPLVEGLEEGSYDLEITRYILAPGDSADLPEYNGTGLTMVLSGEVEVRGERVASLAEGDGQTMMPDSGAATVSNNGSDVAMYVFVSLGDVVSDDTAGAGTASQAPTSEATAAPAETPNTSVSEETPETDAETEPAAGDGVTTSINVSALNEVYITVTVDGTTAYDGTLAAGQSTGPIIGTTFEVYTSSGESTQFTNACGLTFNMGYETGEATYVLEAAPDSCAP